MEERSSTCVPIATPTADDFELVHEVGENFHTAIFNVPRGLEQQLARNSINANGGSFVLEIGRPGTVKTTFYSNNPRSTAQAIQTRLTLRIQDPTPPGAEECSIC
jgi:hypothetical protein